MKKKNAGIIGSKDDKKCNSGVEITCVKNVKEAGIRKI